MNIVIDYAPSTGRTWSVTRDRERLGARVFALGLFGELDDDIAAGMIIRAMRTGEPSEHLDAAVLRLAAFHPNLEPIAERLCEILRTELHLIVALEPDRVVAIDLAPERTH